MPVMGTSHAVNRPVCHPNLRAILIGTRHPDVRQDLRHRTNPRSGSTLWHPAILPRRGRLRGLVRRVRGLVQ